jgi:Inner membrane protein YgaP-like, transmembrane domain
MTANVGNIDRVLRFIVGFALIALPFLGSVDFLATGALKWLSVVVGLVLVATAGMKFCPIYRLLGIRTCRV